MVTARAGPLGWRGGPRGGGAPSLDWAQVKSMLEDRVMPHEVTLTSEMRQCARLCHECKDACLELVPHCLGLGGAHAAPEHIVMLLDCADICNTSEQFLHRGSAHHGQTCSACAEICEACAVDCERIAEGDRHMRQCADICRRCAESCREMAETAVT